MTQRGYETDLVLPITYVDACVYDYLCRGGGNIYFTDSESKYCSGISYNKDFFVNRITFIPVEQAKEIQSALEKTTWWQMILMSKNL
jgi:hypothetical protein